MWPHRPNHLFQQLPAKLRATRTPFPSHGLKLRPILPTASPLHLLLQPAPPRRAVPTDPVLPQQPVHPQPGPALPGRQQGLRPCAPPTHRLRILQPHPFFPTTGSSRGVSTTRSARREATSPEYPRCGSARGPAKQVVGRQIRPHQCRQRRPIHKVGRCFNWISVKVLQKQRRRVALKLQRDCSIRLG